MCVAEVLLQRHPCCKKDKTKEKCATSYVLPKSFFNDTHVSKEFTQKKFATESLLQMFLQQDDEGTGPLDGPDQTDVEAADLNQFIFYPLRHFC